MVYGREASSSACDRGRWQMRKSPVRHHVRTYRRESGKTVNDYERGHGSRKAKVSTPRIVRRTSEKQQTGYHIRIIYSNLGSESFPVTASSYPEAIEVGLTVRTKIEPPMQVEVKKLHE